MVWPINDYLDVTRENPVRIHYRRLNKLREFPAQPEHLSLQK